MEKDFKKWHSEKSQIHEDKKRPFFHEREVWFASLGVNIGFEQDGRGERFLRPAVVVRKFNNEVLWAVPLTKHLKKGIYYYTVSITGRRERSAAILSQVRLIDSKRLQYKIGDVTENDFAKIKKRIAALLNV